jgi:TolB-like protein
VLRTSLPLATLVALLPSLASADKPSVAVMDLKARGVDEAAVGALSTEVTNALASLRVLQVISGEDVRRLLALEETRQGCTGEADAACMAEIGGALGVGHLVYGEVARVGKTYSLSLVLLDTQKASAINRANAKVDEASALLGEIGRLARKLVAPLLEGKSGSLVLDVREAGARVKIDGRTVGVTPLGRQTLTMGPHEVVVEKPGFLAFARTVDVLADQVAVEAVTLVPNEAFIAEYEAGARTLRTMAWAGAATTVALLGTAGVLRLVNDARFDDLVSKQYLSVRGPCVELDPTYNGTDLCPTELGQQNGVVDTVESIETLDGVALGAGIGAAVVGLATVLMFVLGDEPGHYAPFASAGPAGASAGLLWQF